MAVVKRGKRYGVVTYRAGVRRWVGTFDTKNEANDADAKARLDAKEPGSGTTVKEFADSWLRNYPRPKESTEIHYEQMIRLFVREFGKLRLRDLSRVKLRAWAVGHPGAAQVARAMLSDAQRDRLIAENLLTNLRLPGSRGRKDIVALREDDVQKLSECAIAAHGPFGVQCLGPMIRLAAFTGVRPGELFALRWQDVSVERGLMVVTRQWNHRTQKYTSPKNGRPRDIELIPEATKALRDLEHRASTELLFVTKQGKPFNGATHYYWNPVRVAFGRPDMDFYELRHAFGSLLARMGVGAPAIAQMMGHTDGGKLALERYIHMAAEDSRDEVRRAFAVRPSLHVVSSAEAASV